MSAAFFRGIRVTSFGSSGVLKVDKAIPALKPSKSQVLIRILAAGVNPVDTYIRSGNYGNLPSLPYIPGKDGAGIVEEVGEEVTNFKKGDRVYTITAITGTYAEYSLSESSFVHRLNDKASFEQGACLGVPYFTAFRALFQRGRAVAGETVLIHGASGGVGIACVQLAKSRGLKVIGTAGTEAGRKLVKDLGADLVLDHSSPTHLQEALKFTENKGVDLIIEMLANVNLGNDLPILGNKGRVAVVGNRGNVEINPRELMKREAEIFGVMLYHCSPQDIADIAKSIDEGFEKGTISPVVEKTYTLETAAEAHDHVVPASANSSGANGRVVISIPGN